MIKKEIVKKLNTDEIKLLFLFLLENPAFLQLLRSNLMKLTFVFFIIVLLKKNNISFKEILPFFLNFLERKSSNEEIKKNFYFTENFIKEDNIILPPTEEELFAVDFEKNYQRLKDEKIIKNKK